MPIGRLVCSALSLSVLVAACGGEEIQAATYTCGQFAKSLDTKDDRSAGTFIRLLNDRAQLTGSRSEQEKRMAYAIFVACRGEKAGFRPANEAVANARKIAAGKRVVPADVAARERERARKAAAEAKKAEPAE